MCIAFSFGLCTCFFRLLQLFSFSSFGNNKKFGPYKRKIIFLSIRAQRRNQVSHPKKDNDFSRDRKMATSLGTKLFIVSKERVISIRFVFISVTCVVPWFCYLCDSVTSDTLWTNPNPD